MIQEGDKVRLTTGEIAFISEVLEADVAYIAEIFRKNGGVEVDQISHTEIKSVYVENEVPISQAV